MSKHTPGPWEVHSHHHATEQLWLSIGVGGRGPICDVISEAHQNYKPVNEAEAGSVAELKYLVTDSDEQVANARLIAAAPQLLEALEELTETVRDCIMESKQKEPWTWEQLNEVFGYDYEQAKAAICAARGESDDTDDDA